MNVLIVCNNAYMRGNGICTAVTSLLSRLKNAGIEARLLACKNPETDGPQPDYPLKHFKIPLFEPIIYANGFRYAKADRKIIQNPHKDDKDYGKSRIKGAVESFFELDGMVEYSFIDDVVHEIDNSYRTINNKNARAIGGLSIGAVQAMHITANYPEYFGYIGLYSSMVHPVLRHSEHSSIGKTTTTCLCKIFSKGINLITSQMK